MIPYVGRDVFRDWIRRGRARYRKHHNGKNPNWSYMLLWSMALRLHAHTPTAFFGISRSANMTFILVAPGVSDSG